MSTTVSLLLAIAVGGVALLFFWLESRVLSRVGSVFFALLGFVSLVAVFAALIIPNFHDSANAGAYIFVGVLICGTVLSAAGELFPYRRSQT